MQRGFSCLWMRARVGVLSDSFLTSSMRGVPFLSTLRVSQKEIHCSPLFLNSTNTASSSSLLSSPSFLHNSSIHDSYPPSSGGAAGITSSLSREKEENELHLQCCANSGNKTDAEKQKKEVVEVMVMRMGKEGEENTVMKGTESLIDSSSSSSSTCTSSYPSPAQNATTVACGPYRRVGNIFVVLCVDHPFKHSWEINRMLRELRLEYMGQVTIVPDIPVVRRQLWRVRHVVRVDVLDLDEAKALVGIPEHMSFTDLNAQITPTFGRGKSYSSPVMRSKAEFLKLRRTRLRDILHRDQLEKELLEEKRRRFLSETEK